MQGVLPLQIIGRVIWHDCALEHTKNKEMSKIKITVPDEDVYGDLKGKVIKIDSDNVDFGDEMIAKSEIEKTYIPKVNVQTDIQERLDKQATSLKLSLLEDDEHVRSVLTAKGVPLDDAGEIVQTEGITTEELATKIADQVKIAQSGWEKDVADPLRAEVSTLVNDHVVLRRENLHGQILEAARSLGVLDTQFDTLPGAPQSSAAVIAQTEGRFGLTDDGKWALKNETGDGFVHNPQTEEGRPFAGPKVLFTEMRDDKAVVDKWFGDDRAGGGPRIDANKTADTEADDGKYNVKDRTSKLQAMRQQY